MKKVITQPGIYRGVPMAEYHGQPCDGPSISSSGLRTIFIDSPAHYWCTSPLNPEREEPKETEAFVLGRAAHHLLLGEDDFSTLFIARPEKLDGKEWHGNRTVCKEWLEAQADAGRTVITPGQVEQIRGMARSLAKHPLVMAGVLNGEIEQTIAYRDEKTGIWILSRPDAIPNDSGDFADLKGSSDTGSDLDRAVSRYRYDAQAAITKMAYQAVTERQMTSFSFVFTEFKPPHCVDVLTLAGEDIERAEADMRVAIDTFAWCLKTGNWFGPSGFQNDARFVRISDRARENADYRRDFLRREIASGA